MTEFVKTNSCQKLKWWGYTTFVKIIKAILTEQKINS